MFIPDPDFYPSPDPRSKTAIKETEEKFSFLAFFVVIYHKIEKYFIFELAKKKFGTVYKEL